MGVCGSDCRANEAIVESNDVGRFELVEQQVRRFFFESAQRIVIDLEFERAAGYVIERQQRVVLGAFGAAMGVAVPYPGNSRVSSDSSDGGRRLNVRGLA